MRCQYLLTVNKISNNMQFQDVVFGFKGRMGIFHFFKIQYSDIL